MYSPGGGWVWVFVSLSSFLHSLRRIILIWQSEGRAILFGFPSQQDADNWFEDPEYQTLSEHRKRGTKTQFITFIKTLER